MSFESQAFPLVTLRAENVKHLFHLECRLVFLLFSKVPRGRKLEEVWKESQSLTKKYLEELEGWNYLMCLLWHLYLTRSKLMGQHVLIVGDKVIPSVSGSRFWLIDHNLNNSYGARVGRRMRNGWAVWKGWCWAWWLPLWRRGGLRIDVQGTVRVMRAGHYSTNRVGIISKLP